MSEFGTSYFGTAKFGGDPSPYLLLEIDTELTYMARHYLARGSTDGTSIRAVEFSIGRAGIDPFDYRVAIPVNPDAQELEDQIDLGPYAPPTDVTGTKLITAYEYPKSGSSCVYCLLDDTEPPSPPSPAAGSDFISEIGIWAKILYSPYLFETTPPENTFLAAIGHFPLIVKNSSMKYALRVNINF